MFHCTYHNIVGIMESSNIEHNIIKIRLHSQTYGKCIVISLKIFCKHFFYYNAYILFVGLVKKLSSSTSLKCTNDFTVNECRIRDRTLKGIPIFAYILVLYILHGHNSHKCVCIFCVLLYYFNLYRSRDQKKIAFRKIIKY